MELEADQLEGVDTYSLIVIGVLEENAAIFMKSPNSYENNYNDFFWHYSENYEEKPILLFREMDIRDTDIFYIMSGTMLIHMTEKEEEKYQQNLQTLYEIGEISHVTNYALLYEGSKKVIKREGMVYVPIITMLIIIVMFSILYATEMCLSACMPEYVVYFQNGMSIKQGRFLATMTQCVCLMFAYVGSVLLVAWVTYKLNGNKTDFFAAGCILNAGIVLLAGILTYLKVTWICNRNHLVTLMRRNLS